MFSDIVQDHVANPRNRGSLDGATHQGTAGVPGDGPYMSFWFRVEASRVTGATYQTWGCPAAVACGSIVAEIAPGRTPEALLSLTEQDITRLLGGLPEGKEHCPQLTVDALRKALSRDAATHCD